MPDITLAVDYNGYSIRWIDHNRAFRIYRDDVEMKSNTSTLDDCRKWIDGKHKQKFKRVKVLHKKQWSAGRSSGEATSIIDEDYVWVSFGKERIKSNIEQVWLDTPENRQAIKDIELKETQVATLIADIKNIESRTVRLTADMMVEEG